MKNSHQNVLKCCIFKICSAVSKRHSTKSNKAESHIQNRLVWLYLGIISICLFSKIKVNEVMLKACL